MTNHKLEKTVEDLTEQGYNVTVVTEYCLLHENGKQRAISTNWFKTYAQQITEQPGKSKLVSRKVIRVEGDWH